MNAINTSSVLLQYLPPVFAFGVILAIAGFLGLFRMIALSKTADDKAVQSLERQLKIITEENELLRHKIDSLNTKLRRRGKSIKADFTAETKNIPEK